MTMKRMARAFAFAFVCAFLTPPTPTHALPGGCSGCAQVLLAPFDAEVNFTLPDTPPDQVDLSGKIHIVARRTDTPAQPNDPIRISVNLANVAGTSLAGVRFIAFGASDFLAPPPSPTDPNSGPYQFDFVLLVAPPDPFIPPDPVIPPDPFSFPLNVTLSLTFDVDGQNLVGVTILEAVVAPPCTDCL